MLIYSGTGPPWVAAVLGQESRWPGAGGRPGCDAGRTHCRWTHARNHRFKRNVALHSELCKLNVAMYGDSLQGYKKILKTIQHTLVRTMDRQCHVYGCRYVIFIGYLGAGLTFSLLTAESIYGCVWLQSQCVCCT